MFFYEFTGELLHGLSGSLGEGAAVFFRHLLHRLKEGITGDYGSAGYGDILVLSFCFKGDSGYDLLFAAQVVVVEVFTAEIVYDALMRFMLL